VLKHVDLVDFEKQLVEFDAIGTRLAILWCDGIDTYDLAIINQLKNFTEPLMLEWAVDGRVRGGKTSREKIVGVWAPDAIAADTFDVSDDAKRGGWDWDDIVTYHSGEARRQFIRAYRTLQWEDAWRRLAIEHHELRNVMMGFGTELQFPVAPEVKEVEMVWRTKQRVYDR